MFLGDVIIEYSSKLLDDKDIFSCKNDNDQFTWEEYVIIGTWKEESDPLSSDDQHDQLEGDLMEK